MTDSLPFSVRHCGCACTSYIPYIIHPTIAIRQSYLEPLHASLRRNLEFKTQTDKKVDHLREQDLVLRTCKEQLYVKSKWVE